MCGGIGPLSRFDFSMAAPAAWHEIGVTGEASGLTCFGGWDESRVLPQIDLLS